MREGRSQAESMARKRPTGSWIDFTDALGTNLQRSRIGGVG